MDRRTRQQDTAVRLACRPGKYPRSLKTPFHPIPTPSVDTPWALLLRKSRRRRAYPQQIVTTRLLYCLQDPFAHPSRLQGIRPRSC